MLGVIYVKVIIVNNYKFINESKLNQTPLGRVCRYVWSKLNLDLSLLCGLLLLTAVGLAILYSASNESMGLLGHQIGSFGLAFGLMCLVAQIPPHHYRSWAPWIFFVGILMLLAVLSMGVVSKGAQRWLSLGVLRFQPSEIMKIAMPMMLAWYLKDKPSPLTFKTFVISGIILLIPVLMIAKQPDLGTAIIVALTGIFVLLLAGLSWKLIASISSLLAIAVPIGWHFMHDYQKARILTFLSPEKDPLGTGYNIIQSKIAIGSGGLLGKGWLHGSQVHLQFLPEHATDFIFAGCGEEFGFIGCALLLSILLYIVVRGLCISANAHDTFTRLLAGSLILTFFSSFFVNIGMVIGLLPVVGLPLPLVSYGGSSLVILMISFGMIMSIHAHRRLM